MRTIATKRMLLAAIAVFSVWFMAGCAAIVGVEKGPEYRNSYGGEYWPPCLVAADRALDEARAAGKDRQCPEEFNALKEQVDKAYRTHLACNTAGACKMAQDAAAKVRDLSCAARVEAPPPPPRYKYCTTMNPEFDICKTEIRPEYHNQMAKAGKFMQQYPDTTAIIEGHTDNVPITTGPRCQYKDNMELSQARAESAVNYLVEKFGIDRSRLTAKGYGDTRPIADNATNEGRQKNRRIDAIVDCAILPEAIKPDEELCMTLAIEFDTGKADIKPRYRDLVANVADYLKKYPDTKALIEGHTDNVGSDDVNMKLSQQRAESVVNYLVQNFGIDRSRLTAKGYGSSRPIAYNTTPEGRQKNRRIDAVIDCVPKK